MPTKAQELYIQLRELTCRLLGVKTSTDLSILELNEEIKFTEHVRPVCLPASTQEMVPPPGNYDNHSYNTIHNVTEPTLLLLVILSHHNHNSIEIMVIEIMVIYARPHVNTCQMTKGTNQSKFTLL